MVWGGENIWRFRHSTSGPFISSIRHSLRSAELACAVLSLKPGQMEWVRDFDFMLNLFSFSSPYRPFWSYPRNRPLVNGRESQSLAAATIPQKFGHCICSTLKYVECTYVFKHKPELVKKVFMLYVFRVGLLNKLLLLWWCVTVMVMCYCYGDVLLLRWCVTVMAMCCCYGDVLLLWWCVTLMVLCYCYGDVLLLWWCYCYGDVLHLWWCVTVMVMCYLHPYQTSTRTGAIALKFQLENLSFYIYFDAKVWKQLWFPKLRVAMRHCSTFRLYRV